MVNWHDIRNIIEQTIMEKIDFYSEFNCLRYKCENEIITLIENNTNGVTSVIMPKIPPIYHKYNTIDGEKADLITEVKVVQHKTYKWLEFVAGERVIQLAEIDYITLFQVYSVLFDYISNLKSNLKQE